MDSYKGQIKSKYPGLIRDPDDGARQHQTTAPDVEYPKMRIP